MNFSALTAYEIIGPHTGIKHDLYHISWNCELQDLSACVLFLYNNGIMPKQKMRNKKSAKKKTSDDTSSAVCFNRDCKLRKQKKCTGFEGCPGYQGK